MNDTDKYEGHTPAPWDELLSVGVEDQQGWDALLELGFNDEARQLIADAPLILEAYKRLREGIEKALIPTDKVPWAHELLKLSGLRDALKELIE